MVPRSESEPDGPWNTLRYAVVDVEGNGQHPPEIVELACAPLINGAPGDIFTLRFQPSKPITPLATRIHGIRNTSVAGAPTFEAAAPRLMDALGTAVLVAHAAHVERDILARQLTDWHPLAVLDTMRLAKKVWPSLASYKLTSLQEHLAATAAGRSHSAAHDAELAREIFLAGVDELSKEGPVTIHRLRDVCGIDIPLDEEQLALGV